LPAGNDWTLTRDFRTTAIERIKRDPSFAGNEPYKTPATIDDPGSLSEIEEALGGLGYAKARAEGEVGTR